MASERETESVSTDSSVGPAVSASASVQGVSLESRILALQRTAGNRAVALMLQRAGRPKAPPANLDSDLGSPRAIQDLKASPAVPMDPELVEHARKWRLDETNLGKASWKLNVAVIKYLRDGVVDYLVVANDPTKLHSEHVGLKRLEAADPEWTRTRILAVYSERQPCSGCANSLDWVRSKIKFDFPTYFSVAQWQPTKTRAGELAKRYLTAPLRRTPVSPATASSATEPAPVSAEPVATAADVPAVAPDVPAVAPDVPAVAPRPPRATCQPSRPRAPYPDVPPVTPDVPPVKAKGVVDAPAPAAKVPPRPRARVTGVTSGVFIGKDVLDILVTARNMRIAEGADEVAALVTGPPLLENSAIESTIMRTGPAVLEDAGGEYTLLTEYGRYLWNFDSHFKVYISGPRKGETVPLGYFEYLGEVSKANAKYGYFDLFGNFVPGEVMPVIIDPNTA